MVSVCGYVNIDGLREVGYTGQGGAIGRIASGQAQLLNGCFAYVSDVHANGVAIELRLALLPLEAHHGREGLLSVQHPAVGLVSFEHELGAIHAADGAAQAHLRGASFVAEFELGDA